MYNAKQHDQDGRYKWIGIIIFYYTIKKKEVLMLSEQIAELELENKELKELLKQVNEGIPKSKKCENCKFYIRHYGRASNGVYFNLYTGHCTCGVPVKQRRGKKEPTPDDTCSCFESRK